MSTRIAELLVAVGMLLLSLALMLNVLSGDLVIGWIPGRGPGAGMWPFWLSLGMVLATAWTILRWFRGTTPESRNDDPYIDPQHMWLVAVSFIALTAMIVLVYIVGTYLAVGLFMAFYLKAVGRHPWGITTAFAVGTPLFIYFLFEWQLTKYLPKGLPPFEEAFLYLDNYRYALVEWWSSRGQGGSSGGVLLLGVEVSNYLVGLKSLVMGGH